MMCDGFWVSRVGSNLYNSDEAPNDKRLLGMRPAVRQHAALREPDPADHKGFDACPQIGSAIQG